MPEPRVKLDYATPAAGDRRRPWRRIALDVLVITGVFLGVIVCAAVILNRVLT